MVDSTNYVKTMILLSKSTLARRFLGIDPRAVALRGLVPTAHLVTEGGESMPLFNADLVENLKLKNHKLSRPINPRTVTPCETTLAHSAHPTRHRSFTHRNLKGSTRTTRTISSLKTDS